jgi:hypothetical protein
VVAEADSVGRGGVGGERGAIPVEDHVRNPLLVAWGLRSRRAKLTGEGCASIMQSE